MDTDIKCLSCGETIRGRKGKKYCDVYCKSSYQYQKKKNKAPDFYSKVDKQLKTNRKLLSEYNKAGKSTVRADILLNQGFDPKFFTHYWKNKKGDVYLFVYEFGFIKRQENTRDKYILIKWQSYME